ncbi:MAG TPA: Hsp20/alpha crystallin family protein [Minicystis sp.]|nr:Hsp20/alpha crystallin family protein [Minicystis sp.]
MNLENAIREVQTVYLSLTGQPIQPTTSELPPEVDPKEHVERRYRELRAMLETGGAAGGASAAWTPAADVVELVGEVRVDVDLPGVPRESAQVTLVGGWLVVRGERPMASSSAGAMRVRERQSGPFVKVVALPASVSRDGVEATLRDGVLSITLPLDPRRDAEAEVRVPVNGG